MGGGEGPPLLPTPYKKPILTYFALGTIPSDWIRGLVVPIWKGKGDRQDCNNYRGITLLRVPKMLEMFGGTEGRNIVGHMPQGKGRERE